jgi:biotin transport system substrate-specific component
LSSRVKKLVYAALFAALTAVSAWVTIPLPYVPITLQTFFVILSGGALGAYFGALSMVVYLLLGFMGLPVFARGQSGLGVLAGPTGGYLVGFVLAAAVVGRLAEMGWDRTVLGAVAAMVVGNAVIYVVGLPWLAAATGFTPTETVVKGLEPFLLGDVFKLLLAGALFPLAWWIVGRRPGER